MDRVSVLGSPGPLHTADYRAGRESPLPQLLADSPNSRFWLSIHRVCYQVPHTQCLTGESRVCAGTNGCVLMTEVP